MRGGHRPQGLPTTLIQRLLFIKLYEYLINKQDFTFTIEFNSKKVTHNESLNFQHYVVGKNNVRL